jgi:hypothetical protein
MPIYFNVPDVREFLLDNGVVFTLRKPRSEGETYAVVGSYCKHKTIAIVRVKLEKTDIHYAEDLGPYFSQSGLVGCSVYDWFELAKKMSGETLNLYKVTLVEKI